MLFNDILAGTAKVDRAQLRRLEACGLPIYDDGADMLRPYRVLRPQAPRQSTAEERPFTSPMMVRMFRSFEAQIDGRDIPWVRRRDQQIVKYLLLKPDGKASRTELASVFWSDTDRHQATQSVRTACSTIRKAFAAVVGYAAVDTYFRTTPDVQIDLTHVACDVRRFVAHIADADNAYVRDDKASMAMHYRAAQKLYLGPLLPFEASEPFFAAQANLMQERYVLALERLGDMAFDEGQYVEAQQYAHLARSVAPEQPGVLRLLEKLASRSKGVRAASAETRTQMSRTAEIVPAEPRLQSV